MCLQCTAVVNIITICWMRVPVEVSTETFVHLPPTTATGSFIFPSLLDTTAHGLNI
jgi:hypothetical protein